MVYEKKIGAEDARGAEQVAEDDALAEDTLVIEPADREPGIDVLRVWGLEGARVTPISIGHINRTYSVVSEGGDYILQWLNPIFSPALHYDIDAITAELDKAGLVTPRLIRTGAGALWADSEAYGGVWRLQTRVEGVTLMRLEGVGSAHRGFEAGALLGRFHRALWSFEYRFQFGRLGVHDTPKHILALRDAVATRTDHDNFAAVEPVAEAILGAMSRLRPLEGLPERIVHGDPKISNILFTPDGAAICLVDLDTLARMPIAVELGDAFRSWCCPVGEDQPPAGVEGFDVELFDAGLSGYASSIGKRLGRAEWDAVVETTELIAVELAARFCADALNESYFGWDRQRFPSASAHNLVRAEAQLALGSSIHRQQSEMQAIVRRLAGSTTSE